MASGGSDTSIAINLHAQALQKFHNRCGQRITLTNGNRTATRSMRDFNYALVFSAEPLLDDVLFEVVIDKKNDSWGGSIEIGVTEEAPDKIEMPSCATAMRNGCWLLSGIDVRRDGVSLVAFYGTDLESLEERDRVGVMRTSNNELIFYVNGESQGVAARNVPKVLWGLVDLYGQCIQVSIWPTNPSDMGGSGDFLETCLQSTQQIVQQSLDVPMVVDVCVNSSNGHSCVSSSDHALNLNASLSTLGNSSSTSSCAIMTPNPINPNALTSASATSVTGSLQSGGDFFDMDRLRFHTRCGSLVKLSPNCRTAERRRPLDEFNNGVVMTHRPLRDNELFEIRIDKLVDKWSGSIEVGVTTHNPSVLHFPATMTNMRSGTIMMSGCGILTNGKGTRRQYGEFNLDELREGDRVGMMRKVNGNLHYYINGQDQGVAAVRVATTLWGVIDLYGMTIKVTIVDRDEREQQNLVTRRNNLMSSINALNSSGVGNVANGSLLGATAHTPVLSLMSPDTELNTAVALTNAVSAINDSASATLSLIRSDDRLLFHPLCGSQATVTHSGRTALRPNASEDFNNGVVLTRRVLRPNELFQVRLERVVAKWAGSVEIGVTTYSAEELDFPFTMTNVRSGTWMMTGNGVMHNGKTVIEQYGQNLDRLQVGDRVGVVRKDDGTLHFWVNGVDQGPAATNVPDCVYGVIDLYGQAAQASIIDDVSECGSPDTGNSTISNTTLYSEPPLRFHTIHGKNAEIWNGGLTASRPNSLAEFNDAVVFSNRPLRQRELFEVVLETMVRHWSGNIEIGVTGTRPDDIQLTAKATDLDCDTIILCGNIIFHNRRTIRANVPIDLDMLGAGTRIGVMRNGDFLHFFIDGVDQGPACECTMPNVWAIIDLYGVCAQVTLTQAQPDLRAPYATSENSQSCQATSVIQPATIETRHRWTCVAGNVTLSQNWTVASRVTGAGTALSRCVVFSEHPLAVGAPFEMKITAYNSLLAGSLNVGVTDLNLSDEFVRKNIPMSMKRIPANVWYVSGNEVRRNSNLMQYSTASLEWLRIGDRITLELTSARTMRILLNSEDRNISFSNVPNDVYVVVELKGTTMGVQVVSTSPGVTSPLRPCSLRLQDSLELAGIDPLLNKQDSSMLESIDSELSTYEFAELHGKNIRLLEDRRSAMRTQSYNNGLVFVTKPLVRGESISIKIDAVDPKWKGTIGLGVIGFSIQFTNLLQVPASIMQLKRRCWVATHDYLNINGQKIPSKYGEVLANIQVGTVITMTLLHTGVLVVMVGSKNLEDLAGGIPGNVYPVFDVYGMCEKITLITGNDAVHANGTPIEDAVMFEHDSQNEQSAGNSMPQREKADMEVHEKDFDAQHPQYPANAAAMSRSVMDSVSENLMLNLSIKNRTLESNRAEGASSSCCLRESLQLQHNTNLNIQRSQSTQRFQTATVQPITSNTASCTNAGGGTVQDTNKEYESSLEAIAALCVTSNNGAEHQSENNGQMWPEDGEVNGTDGDDGSSLMNLRLTRNCNYYDCSGSNGNERADGSHETEAVASGVSNHHINLTSQEPSFTDTSLLSLQSNNSILSIERKDCDYMKLVRQFFLSLVLPQTFFEAYLNPICFCLHCNGPTSNKLTDWVYFKINQEAINVGQVPSTIDNGEWLPLYYMSRVDKIRAILDHGQPLPMEVNLEVGCSGSQKDEPGQRLELYLSPNEPEMPLVNVQHMNDALKISAAFEVYVRRQSLCMATLSGLAHETNPQAAGELPSLGDDGDELANDISEEPTTTARIVNTGGMLNANTTRHRRWFTKEAGACTISALLLKVDKRSATKLPSCASDATARAGIEYS